MKINKISYIKANNIKNLKHSEKKVSLSGSLTTIPVDNTKKVLSKLPVLGASAVGTYALSKNLKKQSDNEISGLNPSKNKNDEMDKMFKDNGFIKTKNGNVFKIPSPLQIFSILKSFGGFGKYGFEVLKAVLKPADTYKQYLFRDFLETGNNKEFAKDNFNKLYQVFCILYDEGNFFKLNDALKENPDGVQVIQNFAKNPPNILQSEALIQYKGNIFISINNEMRYDNFHNHNAHYRELIRESIKHISSYIDKQIIEKPIKLYRGEILNGLFKNVKLENGSTINLIELMQKEKPEVVREFVLDNEITAHQPSFLSTSLDKNVALNFAKNKMSYNEKLKGIMELTTAPYTKGAFLEYASNMKESEVLLNKNSEIKLKDINYDDENGIWIIKAEVSN